jgi:7-carboxy-7-deazaguanine synthase
MLTKITEQFLTIQGEGRSVGQTAYFIRLAGCNLWCGWCDSMHSVDPNLYKDKSFEIDYSSIPKNCSLVVLTGGEPTLFDLRSIKTELRKINPNVRIEVESNATIFPKDIAEEFYWNLSPKLKSSAQKTSNQDQLRLLSLPDWIELSQKNPGRIIFKFVCTHEKDLAEITELVRDYKIPPPLVFLMNEGQTAESQSLEKINYLIEYAKAHGFNFSPRLHVMYWGSRRGV